MFLVCGVARPRLILAPGTLLNFNARCVTRTRDGSFRVIRSFLDEGITREEATFYLFPLVSLFRGIRWGTVICFYLETNLGIDVSSAYSLVESYSRDRFYKLGFPFYPLVLLLSTIGIETWRTYFGNWYFCQFGKGIIFEIDFQFWYSIVVASVLLLFTKGSVRKAVRFLAFYRGLDINSITMV